MNRYVTGAMIKSLREQKGLTQEELAAEPEKYLYDIIGTAEHTESGELLMVYRPRYGEGRLFVRPLAMFLSEVDREPRFFFL